jgi:hypothetical protein
VELIRDAARLLCALPPMRRIVQQGQRWHMRSPQAVQRRSSLDQGDTGAAGLDVTLGRYRAANGDFVRVGGKIKRL